MNNVLGHFSVLLVHHGLFCVLHIGPHTITYFEFTLKHKHFQVCHKHYPCYLFNQFVEEKKTNLLKIEAFKYPPPDISNTLVLSLIDVPLFCHIQQLQFV